MIWDSILIDVRVLVVCTLSAFETRLSRTLATDAAPLVADVCQANAQMLLASDFTQLIICHAEQIGVISSVHIVEQLPNECTSTSLFSYSLVYVS